MSTRMQAATRETARDFLIVSVFGFWATLIGFMPVVVIHALIS